MSHAKCLLRSIDRQADPPSCTNVLPWRTCAHVHTRKRTAVRCRCVSGCTRLLHLAAAIRGTDTRTRLRAPMQYVHAIRYRRRGPTERMLLLLRRAHSFLLSDLAGDARRLSAANPCAANEPPPATPPLRSSLLARRKGRACTRGHRSSKRPAHAAYVVNNSNRCDHNYRRGSS